MQSFDAKRTQVAQTAFDFARYFTETFGRVRVLGAAIRRPELAAPEGMSTGGGKQARQPVLLQADAPGAAGLTVGWVEMPTRKAMLRTYRCLAGVHEARFRRPLDVDQASYQGFFDQAYGFFASCGLEVTVEDQAPATLSNRPPPSPAGARGDGSGQFMATAAVAFVAFAVGAVVGGLAVYARFVGF